MLGSSTCESDANMKRLFILLATGLVLLPTISPAAQTAQARLHCRSLRVERGRETLDLPRRWTMDMTSLATSLNGELAPDIFNSGYSNRARVEMTWGAIGQVFPGVLWFNVPNTGDANTNGLNDFFEVSQVVADTVTSRGAYQFVDDGFGSGTCEAVWTRDAGAALGYFAYAIPSPFGGELRFLHAFELIEYAGSLTYTPGATTVAGDLSLTEANPSNTLLGPVAFGKSATNRFNQLTFQSAYLTNAASQTWSLFTNTTILRRTAHPTNYFGPVEFNDGDFNTPSRDYSRWWLSVDDPNDADHDGIPDFSDDLASVLPRPPTLALARAVNNLLLTISGDVGRLHHLLESTNLGTGNWKTNLSLTLTNDPQTVALPLPPGGLKFWRALAE